MTSSPAPSSDIPHTTLTGGLSLSVSKIVCVGRNYADHAKEMGAERPSEPMLFLKPSSALWREGSAPIRLPGWSAEVHHEVELVVRVSQRLCRAGESEAAAAVDSYGVGLDLTARDIQAMAKSKGHPWSVAKGFDGSAPLSELLPVEHCDEMSSLPISLAVNGTLRQQGNTKDMLWPLAELLAYASSRFTLMPGDLVFTGTPAGVAALRGGDQARAAAGAATLNLTLGG